MTPEQHEELVRQLAELRQQSVSQRRWLMFTSACVTVLLFFPQLATYIATRVASVVEFAGSFLTPLVAMLAVALVAAVIVSQFTSSKRSAPKRESA